MKKIAKVMPETRAKIVSRYRRGKVTYAMLAAQFGVATETVIRIVRAARKRDQAAAQAAANP